MRRIKFRGLSEGEWYYGLLTFMFSSYAIVDPKDENTVHLVDVKTVGQYTGLKDKKGVEIYEGDVLKKKDSKEIYVLFDSGKFVISVINKKLNYEFDYYGLKGHLNIGYIRIGNIYEKPELLEESAE